MSSYVSLNKKGLKLKNITFMSPLTHTKLNMTNLLSDTQKIMKTNNDSGNNSHQYFKQNPNLTNYKNNNIMTDMYKSYSSNRQNNYLYSNQSSQRRNNNFEKNIYIKNTKSPINSNILSFSQFSNINNSNSNQTKKNINFSYTPSYSTKNYLRKGNSNNIKNYRNKRNTFTENEYLFNSSNNSSSNPLRNSFNSQKYKFNNIFKNEFRNRDNSTHSASSEQLNNPLTQSTSSVNNIKVIYNQLYKRVKEEKSPNIPRTNIIIKDKRLINANSINSNEQFVSTQSSINKKISKSINSNSNVSNENEIHNIKSIDTPEELHFFYINILQNGKEVEGKFEVSSSINN